MSQMFTELTPAAKDLTEAVSADLFLQNTPLLDVRAPVEFARGAFPGSTNIPLLDDDQREQVGTVYKQQGQDAAIALGHKLINPDVRKQRVGAWCEFIEAHPAARLYCFRGGVRSRITQQWLVEAGVVCPIMAGGYKEMRNFMLQHQEVYANTLPFVILGGRTGTGKTKLLEHLPRGIDLEGLARHRGSSFGNLLVSQPTNIDFENALTAQMMQHANLLYAKYGSKTTDLCVCNSTLSRAEHIFLEDEGRLIGRVSLPEPLQERMLKLPVVVLDEPLERRIEVATADYIEQLLLLYQEANGVESGFDRFADHHRMALSRITKRFGGERVTRTLQLFESAFHSHKKSGNTTDYEPYIQTMLCDYYDPMYDYQFAKKQRQTLFQGTAEEILDWVSHCAH